MSREGKPQPVPAAPDPVAEGDLDADSLTGFGVNAGLVEEIRDRYEVDPSSVHSSWANLFDAEHPTEAPAPQPAPVEARVSPELHAEVADQHARVLRLIHTFRARGHRIADTDPLSSPSNYFPELDPAHYGFGDENEAIVCADAIGRAWNDHPKAVAWLKGV